MISARRLNFLLLITAFFYFVTCPSIHTFGEEVKHDLEPKVEVEKLEKKTKKGLGIYFSQLSQNIHTNFFHHTLIKPDFLICSASCFTSHLSILAAIRLIL